MVQGRDDAGKDTSELIAELQALRIRLAELEARETACRTGCIRDDSRPRQAGQEPERYACRPEALVRLGTDLVGSLDEDEICQNLVRGLHSLLGYEALALFLDDAATGEPVMRARAGRVSARVDQRAPAGQAANSSPRSNGQFRSASGGPVPDSYAPARNGGSRLEIPLRTREKRLGTLVVEGGKRNAFAHHDRALLTAIALQAAVALDRAREYQAMRRDLDAKKTSEQQNETRRLYLEAVLACAPDAIVTLDAQHRILEWTPAAQRLFGYEPEEAIGQELDELIASRDAAMFAQAKGFTEKALRGQGVVSPTETVRYRKDGTPVNVLVAGSPILAGNELIGVVAVYTDVGERKRAEEALARRAREMAALYETSLDITAQLDTPTLLHTIVQRAANLLEARMGGLYLLRPDGETLELVVAVGMLDHYIGTKLRLGEGLSGKVAATGQPMMVTDYGTWEGRAEAYEGGPFRRILAVPLKTGDRVIGVINVTDVDRTGEFSDEDVRLVSLFADQAARTIENGRLLAESQRRAKELSILYDTALATSSVLDTDVLLGRLYGQVRRLFDPDALVVGLYDPESGKIRVALAVEAGERVQGLGDLRLPLREGGLTGWVIETRQSLLIGDMQTEPLPAVPAHHGVPVRSWLGVPLIGREQVLGAISVQSYLPHAFDDGHRRLLESLASQIAIAIDTARLYEEAQQRLAALTVLFEASAAVSNSLDLDRVVQITAQKVAAALAAEECVVSVWDRDRDALITLLDYCALPDDPMWREDPPGTVYDLADYPATRTVLTSRRPLTIRASDPEAEPDELALMRMQGSRSMLMIPMVVRDEAVGMLELIERHEERTYRPTELNLCQTLANLTGAALENARLYQAERSSRERAEALRQAAQAVSASLELSEILRLILDQLRGVLVYDSASVLIYRENQAPELILGNGYENEHFSSHEAASLLMSSPILSRMAQDLQPIVCQDVRRLEGWICVPGAEHVRAWLAVPLVAQGWMIGALMVDHRQPGFFQETDVQIVHALAQHAIQAIEHARLFQAEREHRELAERLRETALLVNSSLDLQEVLELMLDQLARVLPYDSGTVQILEDSATQVIALRNLPQAEMGQRYDLERCPYNRRIVEHRQPIVIWDVWDDAQGWVPNERLVHVRANMGVPLQVRDQVIGILTIDSGRPGAYTGAEARLAEGFAQQAAIAIENARLYEETVHRNRELALLNRVIAASAAAQEVEPLLETVCRELALAFGLEMVCAALPSADRNQAQVAAAYPVGGLPPFSAGSNLPGDLPAGLLGPAGRQEPLLIHDVANSDSLGFLSDLACEHGFTSLLFLPLVVDGETIGILILACAPPRALTSEHVDLARRVAAQAAAAMSRIRLAEIQQRLSIAVEQAAESVVITDPEGTILYVNPAFEQITGYCRAEVIGQRPSLLKSGHHDRDFYEQLWQTIKSDRVWKGRFVNRKKDGSLYTEEATISPVHNQVGEAVNYVAVKRDVTREVQLEEQFRQSQKMEAMGRLAGGIAHDFNNLLTVIQVSAWLLQRQIRPEDPLWEYVQRIHETVERAVNLIRQLLSFSRRQIIEPRTINMNDVVGDLSRMLQRIIGEDVHLITVLGPELWPVRVDPTQIEQVIMNLAVNARDAMPEGGTLTIETANVVLDEAYVAYHMGAKPGDHVLMAISDTGVGMTDEVKAHLFEPFFTTKARGQGTGLGLSTVFGIVNQSGGHIWVYTEVGRGTTFKIYLPRDTETMLDRPARAPSPMEGRQGTETILVVEDEAAVRDLIVPILSAQGYQILAAHDPLDALDLSQRHEGRIDLLLTDVIMPHMNGRELAEELLLSRRELAVLYVSGYTDNAIMRHGVLDPGTNLLSKPFTLESLINKVRMVLDQSRGVTPKT